MGVGARRSTGVRVEDRAVSNSSKLLIKKEQKWKLISV